MIVESASIFQMIFDAGPVVKFVMLLLLCFSVVSWAIIFLKFKIISKAYHESVSFTESFWRSRNLSDAFTMAKSLPRSSVAKVFRTGYLELRKISQVSSNVSADSNLDVPNNNEGGFDFSGSDNVKRTLRRSINAETGKLSRYIPFLATAGNTAPFIGLFGTVWGIMNTFQGIGQSGSASLAVVAPGISEALVATAAGLAVAIPSVIGYNYFTSKIKNINFEMQSFAADFLNIVERDVLKSMGNK